MSGGRFPRPGDGLAYLFFRTTPRDRWLLAMLAEHRLLTASQIQLLCFPRARRMNDRLAQLHTLNLIGRFRLQAAPWQGSHCYRYILAPAGAALVAAAHDLTPRQFGYDHAKLQRQQARPDLPHTIGTHDLLVSLAARRELAVWWNQYSLIPIWGDLVRPDAYAVHHDPATGCELGFFLEYDTGSEALPQLLAKSSGYARYAAAYRGHRPILITLPNPAREHALHQRLTATPHATGLPIATATVPTVERDAAALRHLGAGLSGPVWKPYGSERRLALAEIPGYFTGAGVSLLPPAYEDRDVRAPAPVCPSLTTIEPMKLQNEAA